MTKLNVNSKWTSVESYNGLSVCLCMSVGVDYRIQQIGKHDDFTLEEVYLCSFH